MHGGHRADISVSVHRPDLKAVRAAGEAIQERRTSKGRRRSRYLRQFAMSKEAAHCCVNFHLSIPEKVSLTCPPGGASFGIMVLRHADHRRIFICIGIEGAQPAGSPHPKPASAVFEQLIRNA